MNPNFSDVPGAFLVPIEGTSGVPRFNPGEYALVEPNTEPELEDDVLVRLKDGRTMLKRLLSCRGSAFRFGSYNDPKVITAEADEVLWMYYVAHPVPARKIRDRSIGDIGHFATEAIPNGGRK